VAKAVVQVEGRKQLAASMKAAGLKLNDLSAANRAAAQVAAPAAAAAAPVRTGRLAASVRGSGTRAAARIVSRLPYAAPIHFGWPARDIAPQPFAFDAAQQTEPQWHEVYQHHIDQILARIRGV